MRRVFLVLTFVAMWGCSRTDGDNPYSAKSPMHQPFAEMLAKMKAHPGLAEITRKGRNPLESMSMGESLVKKGMARLDDGQLLQLAKLIPDILEQMTPQACGRLLRGEHGYTGRGSGLLRSFNVKSPLHELFDALEAVGVEKGSRYLELTYLALQKAVDGRTTPDPPHPAEIQAAFYDLLRSKFTDQQRNDLIAVFQRGRRAKNEDMCWAVIALYSSISVTSAQHRRVILRFLVASGD